MLDQGSLELGLVLGGNLLQVSLQFGVLLLELLYHVEVVLERVLELGVGGFVCGELVLSVGHWGG